MIGAVTPICSECGIAMCWDIGLDEYAEQKGFWDEWKCRDCNPKASGALKRWKSNQV